MINRVKEQFKITIVAGRASAAPPVGPLLGQRGINIAEFSKQFNEATKHFTDGSPIPVSVYVGKNKTFNMKIGHVQSTFLLKKLACIDKGSSVSGSTNAIIIDIKKLYKLILQEYNIKDYKKQKAICKTLIATGKSMGLAFK